MLADLLIAHNPDPDSNLPFLVRLPLGPDGLVLKTRETWPRTSKVYCHRVSGWPEDAEVLERLPVRTCTRRGPAIDLVLDRTRENRSQLVVTQARGREVIFWQSPRTAKQARPNVALPTRRAAGQVLEVVIDSGEKYAYTFSHQQASTTRRRLSAGDYAVELDGVVVASVERKSLQDLAGSLLSGKLTYALAELTALPRAGLVVEDRYSALFKLEHVAGGRVADALAEAQARFPSVPVMFAETRPLAQEWTYRFLGAALSELSSHAGAALPAGGLFAPSYTDAQPSPSDLDQPVAPLTPSPDPAEVRRWAASRGLPVASRGRLAAHLVRAYLDEHRAPETPRSAPASTSARRTASSSASRQAEWSTSCDRSCRARRAVHGVGAARTLPGTLRLPLQHVQPDRPSRRLVAATPPRSPCSTAPGPDPGRERTTM